MNAEKEKPAQGGRFNNQTRSSATCNTNHGEKQSEFRLEASNWRRFEKNTLQGFFDLTVHPLGLLIKGCTLHSKSGKRWIGFPGKSYTDKEGNTTWQNILEIADRSESDFFRDAALAEVDRLRKEAEG
jgi:hypothetical protein